MGNTSATVGISSDFQVEPDISFASQAIGRYTGDEFVAMLDQAMKGSKTAIQMLNEIKPGLGTGVSSGNEKSLSDAFRELRKAVSKKASGYGLGFETAKPPDTINIVYQKDKVNESLPASWANWAGYFEDDPELLKKLEKEGVDPRKRNREILTKLTIKKIEKSIPKNKKRQALNATQTDNVGRIEIDIKDAFNTAQEVKDVEAEIRKIMKTPLPDGKGVLADGDFDIYTEGGDDVDACFKQFNSKDIQSNILFPWKSLAEGEPRGICMWLIGAIGVANIVLATTGFVDLGNDYASALGAISGSALSGLTLLASL